jgi:hypothetical protein
VRERWRQAGIGVVAVALAAGVFAAGDAVGRRSNHPSATAGHGALALPTARVAVYGDSLVGQSTPYLKSVAGALGLQVTVRAFSGTAPCDFLPDLHKDLAARRADVVVWAFSGNSIGTCMLDSQRRPITGPAIVAKYRVDTQTAASSAEAAGVRFVLVSPPAARSVGDWSAFDSMYRGLAAGDPGIKYVDGGVDIAPGGHFVSTAACLPFERQLTAARGACSSANEIAVRASDGVHFCAVTKHVTCTAYSSGALRYALVILGAVRLEVDYLAETRPPAPPR